MDWAALDAWFEEDEEVFVHPRNPYARVDALHSTRTVQVELDGVVLAESSSPVLVFETGLPTRFYLNKTEVDFQHLVWSDTVTECPYKGRTSGYWSCAPAASCTPTLPGPMTSHRGADADLRADRLLRRAGRRRRRRPPPRASHDALLQVSGARRPPKDSASGLAGRAPRG